MAAATVRCVARCSRPGTLQLAPPSRVLPPQVRRVASAAASSRAPAPDPVQPSAANVLPATPEAPSPSPGNDGPSSSPPSSSRRDRLRDARPFSDFLTDTFRRQHDYLRISVTERCNLRCLYCMPEEGVPLSPPRELLTTPEIVMLSSLFVSQGVTKIRLTGGEPTVRRDIVPLMRQIGALRAHGLRELCLTTNGLSLHRKLDAMVEAGLTGINLSLDTLDPWQFQLMTRRAGFAAVQKSIDRIFELKRAGAAIRFKINCVVMRGLNDREILPFVELTRERDVEVRFIEYMPFDGNKWSEGKMFSYKEMLDVIRSRYPGLQRLQDHKNDTSKTYQVPGFVGKIGFITSMTHNFCGTCNRLRITSDGNLKVCLFGNAEVSLRDVLRKVNKGDPIDEAALESLLQRTAVNETEQSSPTDAQPLLVPNSEELLNLIGMAVKRKKAKHAGIGELEHMKNRPMILIDRIAPSHHHRPQTPPPVQWHHQIGLSSSQFQRRKSPSFFSPGVTSPDQPVTTSPQLRAFSTTPRRPVVTSSNNKNDDDDDGNDDGGSNDGRTPRLTHVSAAGTAHMVSVADKAPTRRVARARCAVRFSDAAALALVRANQLRKGDVLAVARVAGIMAAKRTPDLVPLCHPVALTHAEVDLRCLADADAQDGYEGGRIEIEATVSCDGKTGVEMEALTAASVAALTVYDMCKAVDKGMVIEGLRVVLKEGGRSGRWVEGERKG